MRIAYLQNTPTTAAGAGASVHVAQLARQLLARGHVLISNLADESDEFVKLSEEQIVARAQEIDVFYIRIHGTKSNDAFTALRRANAAAPCVWEINAPLDERRTSGVRGFRLWRHKRRRRKLARLVDGAICVSDEIERYARAELGIARTAVIPNASDPAQFDPASRDAGLYPRDRFVVVWAGSPQYPWQGLRLVERLAAELRASRPEILFAVTAEGASTDNLLYLGRLAHRELPRYLASAHVGLCIYEPIDFYPRFYFSPLKLYDYMASGLAVVGTAQGQVAQVIASERCGVTTDASLADLAAEIGALERDRALAAQMGARGRQAVIRYYNWAQNAIATERFLEDLRRRHERRQRPISSSKRP
jgi:glycosyltransferase involved in cell wall biosynthesis